MTGRVSTRRSCRTSSARRWRPGSAGPRRWRGADGVVRASARAAGPAGYVDGGAGLAGFPPGLTTAAMTHASAAARNSAPTDKMP